MSPKSDITSSGGRAIAWHLRQGMDNGDISRDALALWIEYVCEQHDKLIADNARLREALTNICATMREVKLVNTGEFFGWLQEREKLARAVLAETEGAADAP